MADFTGRDQVNCGVAVDRMRGIAADQWSCRQAAWQSKNSAAAIELLPNVSIGFLEPMTSAESSKMTDDWWVNFLTAKSPAPTKPAESPQTTEGTEFPNHRKDRVCPMIDQIEASQSDRKAKDCRK